MTLAEAAATTSSGFDVTILAQYGVVGLMALVLAVVVRYLYRSLEAQYAARLVEAQAQVKAANERADAALALNIDAQKFIREQLMPALQESAIANAEVVRSAIPDPRRGTPHGRT